MTRLVNITALALTAAAVLLAGCSSSGSQRAADPTAGGKKAGDKATTSQPSPRGDCAAASVASGAPKGVPSQAIALGPDCSLYYYDAPSSDGSVAFGTIVRVTPAGTATTIAGGPAAGDTPTDGPAAKAVINGISSIAVDPKGTVYLANGYTLARITTGGQYQVIMTNAPGATCAYDPTIEGKAASAVKAACPLYVAVDGGGDVFAWSMQLRRVLKIDPAGKVSTFVGGGTITARSGRATAIKLSQLSSIAMGADGKLYVCDGDIAASALYAVAPDGSTTVLGGGGTASVTTGKPLTGESLFDLTVATGAAGRPILFQGDQLVTLGADGRASWQEFNASSIRGDGGPAGKASVGQIVGATVDGRGDVYLLDSTNGRGEIRRIDPGGTITKVA